MPTKDIRIAMARPRQYRRVIRESRDGALEQRCKVTKMKLIGHIVRKDKNSDDVIALTWAITLEGKRKRGSPKTTWRRMIEK